MIDAHWRVSMTSDEIIFMHEQLAAFHSNLAEIEKLEDVVAYHRGLAERLQAEAQRLRRITS
jgi:hypothetical protein